jgi:hypothetical protein
MNSVYDRQKTGKINGNAVRKKLISAGMNLGLLVRK